jgi:hypothetical protein
MDAETQELEEKVKRRGLRIAKLEEDLEQMSRTKCIGKRYYH